MPSEICPLRFGIHGTGIHKVTQLGGCLFLKLCFYGEIGRILLFKFGYGITYNFRLSKVFTTIITQRERNQTRLSMIIL